MMYEIEEGVPIPELLQGAPCKYPFRTMDVGQSFFVPNDGSGVRALQRRVAGSTCRIKDRKFTVRQVEGGVRCWRTE